MGKSSCKTDLLFYFIQINKTSKSVDNLNITQATTIKYEGILHITRVSKHFLGAAIKWPKELACIMLSAAKTESFLKDSAIPDLSFFIFVFSIQFVFDIKFWRWLDSKRGPLVSEATALPTELQPLPQNDSFKMGQPGLFFLYFWSFQTNIITIFTTDQCEKMSCPSSIWRRDSNPRPSEREPPPITTRPGLPPTNRYLNETFVS